MGTKIVAYVISGLLYGCGTSGTNSPNAPVPSGNPPVNQPPPIKPKPIAPRFVPGDCNLENPAFCETFETPKPGGRGGDIDESIWSFSRWGHEVTSFFNRPTSVSPGPGSKNTPTFCGQTFTAIDAPNDVKFCTGTDGGGFQSLQLNEVFNDNGGFGLNELRIRQPFDFTGRTGTLVFDVDAKTNNGFDGHGWWLELWVTEDPQPIPYHGAPTVGSYPRSSIGFQIIPTTSTCFEDNLTEVSRVAITKDYKIESDTAGGGECIKTADGVLNRFKFLISKQRVEILASDADAPGNLRRVFAKDVNLSFSFGYVHLQHSQYNADKVNSSAAQTYRWDNIGFDGPTYPTPRSYEVPDELKDTIVSGEVHGKTLGYYLDSPQNFSLKGVDLTNALRATFNFNYHAQGGEKFRYRFNQNAWHVFTVPAQMQDADAVLMRSFTVEVPLTELLAGDNSLNIENVDSSFHPVIGNIDLTIETSP